MENHQNRFDHHYLANVCPTQNQSIISKLEEWDFRPMNRRHETSKKAFCSCSHHQSVQPFHNNVKQKWRDWIALAKTSGVLKVTFGRSIKENRKRSSGYTDSNPLTPFLFESHPSQHVL
ncbi:hypothetical protein FRX31_020348 [Thalictrum thalictroides]|uniref:Uncharacterized protein n=1 Tax=Thalictrum thalictroides TaxID=46969 RepID=A0A7J6W168_THATH|nr:hypothetical protein FRX31_020348 [Thalictrum thalictroides]